MSALHWPGLPDGFDPMISEGEMAGLLGEPVEIAVRPHFVQRWDDDAIRAARASQNSFVAALRFGLCVESDELEGLVRRQRVFALQYRCAVTPYALHAVVGAVPVREYRVLVAAARKGECNPWFIVDNFDFGIAGHEFPLWMRDGAEATDIARRAFAVDAGTVADGAAEDAFTEGAAQAPPIEAVLSTGHPHDLLFAVAPGQILGPVQCSCATEWRRSADDLFPRIRPEEVHSVETVRWTIPMPGGSGSCRPGSDPSPASACDVLLSVDGTPTIAEGESVATLPEGGA